ncbi:hypothetical protein D3C78_1016370 [compost metagenome]
MTRSAGGSGWPGPMNCRSTCGCRRSGSKSVWLLIRGNTGTTTLSSSPSLPAWRWSMASSASRWKSIRYGSTPSTGFPVRCSSQSRPGCSRLRSPRKRLITKPQIRACSLGDSSSRVPTRWANTPPLSISAIRITGQSTASAKPMLAMSPARRLISAGEPAPSTITTGWRAARRAWDCSTASWATRL